MIFGPINTEVFTVLFLSYSLHFESYKHLMNFPSA